MVTVQLNHVYKHFAGKVVLQDVCLSFPSGSRTCLMAPSGYGKTTLLRLLAGLEMPNSGSVQGIPTRVAVLFQEDRLTDSRTALDNLRLTFGKKSSSDTMIALLHELGLGDDLDKPLSAFSGGMKRRVAIARTLLYEAPLVLLDEPFKGLDEQTKQTVAAIICRYTAGRTLIAVTHDTEDAALLSADIVSLV